MLLSLKRVRADFLYILNRPDGSIARTLYGENRKEAALGLVWLNQINARVMLSRTRRRQYIEDTEEEKGQKRRKTEGETDGKSDFGDPLSEREPSLIRRVTVIFNSAGPSASCDYVVTSAGARGMHSEERPQTHGHDCLQPELNSQPSDLLLSQSPALPQKL